MRSSRCENFLYGFKPARNGPDARASSAQAGPLLSRVGPAAQNAAATRAHTFRAAEQSCSHGDRLAVCGSDTLTFKDRVPSVAAWAHIVRDRPSRLKHRSRCGKHDALWLGVVIGA